ncbi:FecR domain-containing protein [Paucibacter sp. JuS9]|uniref:FecR family protein n=1 Tax=Paucibacter sp. JuS9 TaxID=3228748 RepID=UPI00375795B1
MQAKVLDFERGGGASAAEEARRWVARIDAGDLSATERQQLKDWLAEDSSHARLLDEHALIWAAASQASFAPASARPAARRSSQRPWVWGGAAATGLALALCLMVLRPWQADDDTNFAASHSTAVGQQHVVLLPDGSRTELNAASSLGVAYGGQRRRVVLERGVGLFDVAKDKHRPFEVLVGNTVVRAVGTRFLVQKHRDGSVEVTVYEGVVELRKADAPESKGEQPLRLGIGQVALDQAQQTLLSTAKPGELERKLAWQQGRIVFDDSSLAAALEEVNRYSSEPIELTDSALQQMRISGAFATTDVAVFLRSLEQGFGLKVRQHQGRWLISRG